MKFIVTLFLILAGLAPSLSQDKIEVENIHFTDLPFYTEECRTESPQPLDSEVAESIIDSVFRSKGYPIIKEVLFEHKSIRFPLTGYSPKANIGYVWMDWNNLSIEAFDLFYYLRKDGRYEAIIPDLNSDFDDNLLKDLARNYSGTIDSSVSILATRSLNTSDPKAKRALYTKTLEELILTGVFYLVEFDTNSFNYIRQIENKNDRHRSLQNLLAFQKTLRLTQFYHKEDSLNRYAKSLLADMKLEDAQKIYADLLVRYEKNYLSIEEVNNCIQDQNLPMQIIFFQSNHKNLTIPSQYRGDFYTDTQKQEYERLINKFKKIPNQKRAERLHKKINKIKKVVRQDHLNNIRKQITLSILKGIELQEDNK